MVWCTCLMGIRAVLEYQRSPLSEGGPGGIFYWRTLLPIETYVLQMMESILQVPENFAGSGKNYRIRPCFNPVKTPAVAVGFDTGLFPVFEK